MLCQWLCFKILSLLKNTLLSSLLCELELLKLIVLVLFEKDAKVFSPVSIKILYWSVKPFISTFVPFTM